MANQCLLCKKKFKSEKDLNEHDDNSHRELRLVSKNPISYLVQLPGGRSEGFIPAAQDFVEQIQVLKRAFPQIEFDFIPFTFKTIDGTEPALRSILAVMK